MKRRVRWSAAIVALTAVLTVVPSPTVAGAATVPAPFGTWSALVTRQYQDLTAKAPTAASLSSWTSSLSSGAKTPGELDDALRRGTENLSNVDPVVRIYRAFLRRAPDAGGLEFWIKRKRNVAPARTWKVSQIAEEFTKSSEFVRKYGSLTNRQFVTQIYTDVLERPADPSGVDYWTRQLDAKRRTKATVMVGFSESNEYKRKQAENTDVTVAYVYLLGRAPTAGEATDWVGRAKSGTPHATLLDELLASPSYAAHVTGGTVTAVSGRSEHSCVRMSGGTVKCWGTNYIGQLGNGTTTDASKPTPVPGITSALAVETGVYNSCALLSGGSVKCWGANLYGALGDGSTTSSLTPVSVSGISTATEVSVGDNHSCALLSSGAVKCWGWNTQGGLGNGTRTSSLTPVSVSGITTAVAISAGDRFSCALLSSGTVKCWGNNDSGTMGDGTAGPLTYKVLPVSVSGITTATAISGVQSHMCALLSGGTVKCWGWNLNGSLGDGTPNDATTPVSVSGISTATAVSAGRSQSCALLDDGTVKCWGRNSSGQLGTGTTTSSLVPVSVVGLTDAVAVSAGGDRTCALLSDGVVKCWGTNADGGLGNGTVGGISTTPVTVINLRLIV